MGSHVHSKRVTLRQKHKVARKVREHHRKVRKQSKSTRSGRRAAAGALDADPGIPNSWPRKAELLEKIEEQKRKQQEERETRKQAARVQSLEGLVRKAEKDGLRYERKAANDQSGQPAVVADPSRKAFMKEFAKVVEAADVILEVLDARDPLGCRCLEAERKILAASGGNSKRIVLVLNKVDLVPKEVVQQWLKYLRNDYPTVAFRSSLQSQRHSLGQADASVLNAASLSTSETLGADTIIQLLKNYSRNQKMKTSIAVGVIGFPNVGKSSLINSLKRSKAVNVGSVPGLTKSAQEVHVDKNIRLIDCPGIVFSRQDSDALILRHCIKIEQLEDPVAPVERILSLIGVEALMVAYSLPLFSNINELLALVARKRGKLKKGGSFDSATAARIVLQDWNSGKIPFYTTVPTQTPKPSHNSAQIVQEWSKEFDVEALENVQNQELEKQLKSLAMQPETVYAKVQGDQLQEDAEMLAESDAEMEDESDEVDEGPKSIYKIAPKASAPARPVEPVDRMEVGAGQKAKKEQRKRKKDARRKARAQTAGGEDFDFAAFEDEYHEEESDAMEQ